HRRGLRRRHGAVRHPAGVPRRVLPPRAGGRTMNATAAAAMQPAHRSLPGTMLAAVVGAASSLVLVFFWALAATLVGGVTAAMPLGKALAFGLVVGAAI